MIYIIYIQSHNNLIDLSDIQLIKGWTSNYENALKILIELLNKLASNIIKYGVVIKYQEGLFNIKSKFNFEIIKVLKSSNGTICEDTIRVINKYNSTKNQSDLLLNLQLQNLEPCCIQ